MRNVGVGMLLGALLVIGGLYGRQVVPQLLTSQTFISPVGTILEKPLEKYAILRMSGRVFAESQIVLDEAIATTSAFTRYNFHFMSDGKKTTGVAHIPRSPKPTSGYPVIVQFRGYVDRDVYSPGEGTQRSAEVFARNGFISLAPDFLGYGGSDMPSKEVFEERFQTYTTALNLLSSVPTLPDADPSRIGMWGHSNGGQIALTVLEVLGKPIPTTLWAPVTKPFPYSILYYTDEASDRGKFLRRELAKFEQNYDVDLYSLTSYVDRITAPLQLHQGTADEAVPVVWSDEFVKLVPKATYYTYPGADHNMVGSWDTVVARDVSFFSENL